MPRVFISRPNPPSPARQGIPLLLQGSTPTTGTVAGADSLVPSESLALAGGVGIGVSDALIPTDALTLITGTTKTAGTTVTGTGAGYATLAVDTTRAIAWNQPSTGSDSQTTITSANAAGDGWAVGINDAYGGMPFSSLIERLAGADVNPAIQNGVAGGSGLTQLPTAPANQVSMHTGIYPDGHLHAAVQETSLGYGASEQVQSFTLTELGPTGTSLRRYYHASGTHLSIAYDISACVYPGEPGMVFWKTVLTGPGSSLALTATPEGSVTLASPAGLLPTGGTLPEAGLWNIDSTHAVYGSLANLTSTTTLPISPTETSSDPDLVALVPTAPAGNVATLAAQRLAVVAGRFTKMADVGLTTPQLAAYQNTDRLKVVGGGVFAGGTMPASTTLTFYSVEFLTSSVTAGSFANAFALVADYLQPGTPTVSVGTLVTFSYPNHASFPFNLDEGCYQVAATANAATITLDLGSSVSANIRYKPRLKITGLTSLHDAAGSEISLSLGGVGLSAGTDYAITVDVPNQVAYVQLMVDLVASGATTGQKNNAALALVASPALSFTDTLIPADTLARALSGVLSDSDVPVDALTGSASAGQNDSTVPVDSAAGVLSASYADTTIPSDSLTLASHTGAQLALSDTLIPADTFTEDLASSQSDPTSPTDLITGSGTSDLADSDTPADSLSGGASTAISDGTPPTDTQDSALAATYADSTAPADALVLTPHIGAQLYATDTLIPADSLSGSLSASQSDSTSATDALAGSLGGAYVDSDIPADSSTYGGGAGASFQDGTTLTDSLTLGTSAALSDTTSPTEATADGLATSVGDSTAPADLLTLSNTSGATLILSDTVRPADALGQNAAAGLLDTFTPMDLIAWDRAASQSDTTLPTDSISFAAFYPLFLVFTDSLSPTDALIAYVLRSGRPTVIPGSVSSPIAVLGSVSSPVAVLDPF